MDNQTNAPMRITEHRDAYIKADAEGRAKILAKTYGLAAHQMWKHKQSGKWIVSHAGVQSIAAQESILVDYDPIVVERGFVVIKATPQGRQATFGEASDENTQQKYKVAMAEKRAFDRAVLIAVLQNVGGYGADFYGEDEADDFKAPPTYNPKKPIKERPAKANPATPLPTKASLKAEIEKCTNSDQIGPVYRKLKNAAEQAGLINDLVEMCAFHKDNLAALEGESIKGAD